MAPGWTSTISEETSRVPCTACCTLREISRVAAPCSSTADAIVEQISDIRPIVPPIVLMALTDSSVGKAGGFLNLAADLVERRRHFFGPRRH